MVLSFFAGSIAPTVVEAINKVGSALYGPVLGVFLMAILLKRRSELAANIGLLAGLALNLYFWLFVPDLFWMWWNVIGLIVTIVTGWLISILSKPVETEAVDIGSESPAIVQRYTSGMIAAFLVILVASWAAPFLF
jgi:Na+/proline symporter